MKDTTQANATANTAFGCLNGLAAEPWCGATHVNCTPQCCDFVQELDPGRPA